MSDPRILEALRDVTKAYADLCAENVRLRLELAEAIRHRDEARLVADEIAVEREEAWAAIARVRELCDRYDNDDWSWSVPCDTIRAAIEGNQP